MWLFGRKCTGGKNTLNEIKIRLILKFNYKNENLFLSIFALFQLELFAHYVSLFLHFSVSFCLTYQNVHIRWTNFLRPNANNLVHIVN